MLILVGAFGDHAGRAVDVCASCAAARRRLAKVNFFPLFLYLGIPAPSPTWPSAQAYAPPRELTAVFFPSVSSPAYQDGLNVPPGPVSACLARSRSLPLIARMTRPPSSTRRAPNTRVVFVCFRALPLPLLAFSLGRLVQTRSYSSNPVSTTCIYESGFRSGPQALFSGPEEPGWAASSGHTLLAFRREAAAHVCMGGRQCALWHRSRPAEHVKDIQSYQRTSSWAYRTH